MTSASAAMAGHIVLEPAPDIYVSNLNVVYTSGELVVSGTAEGFTNYVSGSPTFFPVTAGGFTLAAQINSAGVASSGSFSISGYLLDDLLEPVYSPSTGALLSGAVLDTFEFVPGDFDTASFTFSFLSLSGDLAPLYGAMAVLEMNLYTGFPGSFDADFTTSDFSHVADIALAVETPEPGSWGLIAIGALTLAALKRRSSARSDLA